MSTKSPPSEFELQILGVLWERGASTVREVMEHLPDGKPRAYTSVLSVMQVMQKKGLLKSRRQKDGLAHVFEPRVRRDRIVAPMLRGLVDRVFGGRTQDVLQHLLTDDVDHLYRNFLSLSGDLRNRQKGGCA